MVEMKNERMIFINVFSAVILAVCVFSSAFSIYQFVGTRNAESLFSVINSIMALLTAAVFVYSIFCRSGNIKFLLFPVILIIAGIVETAVGRWVTKEIALNAFGFTELYYAAGVTVHIVAAIDIKNGLKRLKFDIMLLTAYWAAGFIFLFKYFYPNIIGGLVMTILIFFPCMLDPRFLLILLLRSYQKNGPAGKAGGRTGS